MLFALKHKVFAAPDLPSQVSRVLTTQNAVLKQHLPKPLYDQLEIPHRHAGINSIRVPGTAEHRREPPLVLLHGFGSGLGFFFSTLPYLAQSGRTIYLVDWLGCGGSDRPRVSRSTVTAEYFTGSLNEWMENEGIDKATIVGHSLGGLLSAEFSEKHPEKVDSLVLASPAGFGSASGRGHNDSFARQLLDMLWNSNMTPQSIVRMAGKTRGHAMVTRAVQGRFSRHVDVDKEILADYLYEITVAPPSGEYALNAFLNPPFKLGALTARRPMSELPGKGQFPVHVIFGDHDWLGTPSAVENAKKMGARLTIMKDAGHHLYMDDAKEFARLCLSS